MTLPTVMANHRKKVLQTQFLKAYSDIQNAAKRFQADEGITVFEHSQNEVSENSTDTLAKLMAYFIGMKQGKPIAASNVESVLGYTPVNLAGNIPATQPCDRSIVTEEVGGRFFSIDDPVSAYANPTNGPKICIDINGRKGPNIYGYDWGCICIYKRRRSKALYW